MPAREETDQSLLGQPSIADHASCRHDLAAKDGAKATRTQHCPFPGRAWIHRGSRAPLRRTPPTQTPTTAQNGTPPPRLHTATTTDTDTENETPFVTSPLNRTHLPQRTPTSTSDTHTSRQNGSERLQGAITKQTERKKESRCVGHSSPRWTNAASPLETASRNEHSAEDRLCLLVEATIPLESHKRTYEADASLGSPLARLLAASSENKELGT